MPRQRFLKLQPELQARILDVATEEFATHGFSGASYNRIIERTGTSKGAMYYYFEDKADLYGTVLRHCLGHFTTYLGAVEPVTTVDAYWAQALEMTRASFRYYRDAPFMAAIARGLVKALQQGQATQAALEYRDALRAWMSLLASAGQAVGAVRTDLPTDLLMSLAVSVSEGVDFWLAERIDELDDDELEALAHTTLDLYRRMAQPAEPTP